jgi:hypothetical protein
MSDKATCPVCDSHTSEIYRAFLNEEDCPCCGASAKLIQNLEVIKATRNALKRQQIEDGIIEENAKLKTKIAHMEDVLEVAKGICFEIETDFISLQDGLEKLGKLDFDSAKDK